MTAIAIARVRLTRGAGWVLDGFRLFRKNPLILIVLTMLVLLLALALSVVPYVGVYLLYLLTPLFLGGMMAACRDVDAGEEIEIAHLFAGFREGAAQLVTVGGVYLVGNVLIAGVTMMLGGEALREVMQATAAGTPQNIDPQTADKAAFAVMVAAALYLPVMMLMWFAPALVMFDKLPAWQALLLSLKASVVNALPFLLYSVIMSALLMLALMLFVIGLALWVPLAVVTTYVSYRDIFGARPRPA